MTVLVDILLAAAVALTWLAAIALVRSPGPLTALHAVTMVNVPGGALITLAAFLSDGIASRSLKCLLIWLASLVFGALLAQVTGRALHLRNGERG